MQIQGSPLSTRPPAEALNDGEEIRPAPGPPLNGTTPFKEVEAGRESSESWGIGAGSCSVGAAGLECIAGCCGCDGSTPGTASKTLPARKLPLGVPSRGEPGGSSCTRDREPLATTSSVGPECPSGTIFVRDDRPVGESCCCASACFIADGREGGNDAFGGMGDETART